MPSDLRRPFDVLVIGAGPAGIAAAVCVAQSGASVGLVDDNANHGGQIWRGVVHEQNDEAETWSGLLRSSSVTQLYGKRVFDQLSPGVLLAEGTDGQSELRYQKLIVATGARERFLPFPGWTLPNVMGAGGLQALVKCGLPIRGARVVVAGTGPLLMAVAAYLRKHGAEIPIICEQTSLTRLAGFSVALMRQPAKIGQAMRLRRQLSGTRFAANSWPIAASGKSKLENVTISHSGISETIACDYLACGFHLVPNLELIQLLACKIESDRAKVDEFQETTVEGVFSAGETTGIAGVDSAIVEGQIAGFAAAGRLADAKRLFHKRDRAQAFARILDKTFRLRPELKSLSSPETLVCRCEDVSFSRLRRQTSWRSAKLQTRCGMGPCQGRICGPATQFLFGWTPDSVRPPIFPARVESLASGGIDERVSTTVQGDSA